MEEQNKKNSINEANRRHFEGLVVSIGGKKTLLVLVKSTRMHSKYRKLYWQKKKYPVHDEKGEAKIGDKIEFVECRPLSKTKKWRLAGIIKPEKN